VYQQTQYEHPEIEPYSRGSWREVAYSWVIACCILALVLLNM